MNRDYKLLDEALQTLLNVRRWISADYNRTHIAPVVDRIRTRLASIEAENFVVEKNNNYNNFDRKKIDEKIKKINEYEPDTVPNSLIEITSNFGIFNNTKSDFCKDHPDAPHRYLKDFSASMGRYVCQCEFWEPKDNEK